MTKHNEKRTARMKTHPMRVLKQLAESGGLSAAAAQYEIDRRNAENKS